MSSSHAMGGREKRREMREANHSTRIAREKFSQRERKRKKEEEGKEKGRRIENVSRLFWIHTHRMLCSFSCRSSCTKQRERTVRRIIFPPFLIPN